MGPFWRMGAVLGAALAAPAVWAGTTALNAMPIADVLGHREAMLYLWTQGNERRVDPVYHHGGSLQVGLWDRLEIGYDDDFEGTATWNAKLLLAEGPAGALSVGWQSIEGDRATPFVVGRLDFRGWRLHAGWLRDGVSRPIAGVDAPLGSWTVMADWIGGDGATAWFGVCGEVLTPGLCLTLSVGVPERRSDGVQHVLCLQYGVRF
ncbi:MAG: hypothetical protein N2109_01885 [Fimbriimonadales bacterium]|nr:hypothetical protein [Fimbriimonadales bacterium]